MPRPAAIERGLVSAGLKTRLYKKGVTFLTSVAAGL